MQKIGDLLKEIEENKDQLDVLTPEMIKAMNPDEEYIKDGNIYCKKCNTRRTRFGFRKKVWIKCKCQMEAYEKEEQEAKQKERLQRVERLRRASLLGDQYKDVSFASTDVSDANFAAIFARCEKYCQVIPQVMKKGHGIYLFGDPGNGKTHLTACMANELMRQNHTVLFTNMGEISKAIRATYDKKGETEQTFMNRLNNVDFLFIDDFGTERVMKDSQDLWLQEKIFDIVNTRYNKLKPMIFTSNYSLKEMIEKRGLSTKTVDRISQKCVALELRGKSYRKKAENKNDFDF
jgi:DNA replication protein DnaC